ncbi:response regulator transcription factor [Pseudonocardia asaccharolytica]|uniref:Response regulatory domain-containing protein n=1 Tax=Pseudonocardia asaccharolytica DSM 44247 = NBRC 16224 TaxID=1123024 RepID=A0A511D092_9PSEU|nr:response regulator transcription factor [Pseudonocardia asaccharolytica]GEL16964.1 hypothetical protein PA7_08010 [Pseudonocardia asaccharolytica DSM 44247 = NBRC 16224]
MSDARGGRPIRVVVVNDQAMVRHGFAALLAAQPGIEVVGDAADGLLAPRVTRRLIEEFAARPAAQRVRPDRLAALTARRPSSSPTRRAWSGRAAERAG